MFFPIGDTQVKGGHYPYVSYSFIILNFLTFAAQMMTEGNLICQGSAIPHNIINGRDLYTLVTSLFLHGGYLHIIGNMLFLWVFADNIEARIGSVRFLFFYIGGGIFATFAHIYFSVKQEDISSCCIPCATGAYECINNLSACNNFIPSLGASGSISAVLGAYLVVFPKSRIKVLVIFLFRSIFVSAWIFLLLWFGQQVLAGFGGSFLNEIEGLDGVAWWAHIGGFVFGFIAGLLIKFTFPEEEEGVVELA
jgi:membrane associated rhomboid family serine protease